MIVLYEVWGSDVETKNARLVLLVVLLGCVSSLMFGNSGRAAAQPPSPPPPPQPEQMKIKEVVLNASSGVFELSECVAANTEYVLHLGSANRAADSATQSVMSNFRVDPGISLRLTPRANDQIKHLVVEVAHDVSVGQTLSVNYHRTFASDLWELRYYLNIARNTLEAQIVLHNRTANEWDDADVTLVHGQHSILLKNVSVKAFSTATVSWPSKLSVEAEVVTDQWAVQLEDRSAKRKVKQVMRLKNNGKETLWSGRLNLIGDAGDVVPSDSDRLSDDIDPGKELVLVYGEDPMGDVTFGVGVPVIGKEKSLENGVLVFETSTGSTIDVTNRSKAAKEILYFQGLEVVQQETVKAEDRKVIHRPEATIVDRSVDLRVPDSTLLPSLRFLADQDPTGPLSDVLQRWENIIRLQTEITRLDNDNSPIGELQRLRAQRLEMIQNPNASRESLRILNQKLDNLLRFQLPQTRRDLSEALFSLYSFLDSP